jgi:hypothetical protein
MSTDPGFSWNRIARDRPVQYWLLWFFAYAGFWAIGRDLLEVTGLMAAAASPGARFFGTLFIATVMATGDTWRARRRSD